MVVLPSRTSTDSLADSFYMEAASLGKRSFPSPIFTNRALAEDTSIAQELKTQMLALTHHPKIQSDAALLFKKYQKEIFFLLGFYSLPYCYAASKGARVLVLSKQIIENPGRRLMETAQFVEEVCQPNAFDKTGKGKAAVYMVRMMHTAARNYASKYITDEVPINQQDMIGTLLSFSLLIIRGLSKLGITLTAKEKNSWMLHWCYIGELLGISSEYLPISLKVATEQEYAIRKAEFRRSEEGIILIKSLLTFMKNEQVSLPFAPEKMMAGFLGKEVASYLGLTYSELSSEWMLAQARFIMSSGIAEYLFNRSKSGTNLYQNNADLAYSIPINR